MKKKILYTLGIILFLSIAYSAVTEFVFIKPNFADCVEKKENVFVCEVKKDKPFYLYRTIGGSALFVGGCFTGDPVYDSSEISMNKKVRVAYPWEYLLLFSGREFYNFSLLSEDVSYIHVPGVCGSEKYFRLKSLGENLQSPFRTIETDVYMLDLPSDWGLLNPYGGKYVYEYDDREYLSNNRLLKISDDGLLADVSIKCAQLSVEEIASGNGNGGGELYRNILEIEEKSDDSEYFRERGLSGIYINNSRFIGYLTFPETFGQFNHEQSSVWNGQDVCVVSGEITSDDLLLELRNILERAQYSK